jgi:hypothetical protein
MRENGTQIGMIYMIPLFSLRPLRFIFRGDTIRRAHHQMNEIQRREAEKQRFSFSDPLFLCVNHRGER